MENSILINAKYSGIISILYRQEIIILNCLYCNATETKVIETRLVDNGLVNRRRRVCPKCGARFTTYERYEQQTPWIIKKDGTRQQFNRDKLLRSMQSACTKLPVPLERLEAARENIEQALTKMGGEIKSSTIGEMVSEELKKINHVAYVRFASVYREFTDLRGFTEEIEKLRNF